MRVWFSLGQPGTGERGFRDLRAGWRLAIFLIVLLGPLALLRLLRALQPGSRPVAAAPIVFTPLELLFAELLPLVWVAVATWILARLEQRPTGAFGLPRRRAFGAQFWFGFLWGAVALSGLLGLIAASGGLSFAGIATHGGALARYGLEWAGAFLVVALFEEYGFRGYALVTLGDGLGFWAAAVLLSAAFGATHLGNRGESWMGALSAGLIGLFFCFTWKRTGSLWFAVGVHFAWDYCESFVYGVPDSGLHIPGHWLEVQFHGSRWITGGTVGPEGSLWVLLVVALLFWLFDRGFPAAGPSDGSGGAAAHRRLSAGA